jgi:hypothetical protein
MLHRRIILPLLSAATLLASAWACSAAGKAYLTPEEAGADFQIQGEYVGNAGDKKVGAQVIALGGGKFQAAFLPGGLPGAGWDTIRRTRVEGKTEGGKTVFGAPDQGWRGAIADGKFTGTSDAGKEFSLAKVQRKSTTLGKTPPPGATVLFNGTNTDAWVNGRMTEDKLLMEGTQTKKSYKNFILHLEFMTSFMPESRGQARANSGVFLDGRYEVQVLDSFGLEGENNECGGIYTVMKPTVNMAYPPLSWQTYDIEFFAPVFDADGKKTKNAVVTVIHNGVRIHDRVEIPKHTAGGQEGPMNGPIQCMNHGDPIRYRNIWVMERN